MQSSAGSTPALKSMPAGLFAKALLTNIKQGLFVTVAFSYVLDEIS